MDKVAALEVGGGGGVGSYSKESHSFHQLQSSFYFVVLLIKVFR